MARKPGVKGDGRKRKAGAKPDRVSLYGTTFSDAMKKAMHLERPAEGWPTRPRRTYKKKSATKKPAKG